MTIHPDYFDYLDHLGATVSVTEFIARREDESLVALRHDVDHDLDLALELSFREQERGCRATYYLLHSASYWSDSRRIEKALQIQDFGHEIGLHLNLLTAWYRGEIERVDDALASQLREFREAGLRIRGVSAHGDRCCYEAQFINYWCFEELKPHDPTREESGRTAEGIRGRDRAERIDYPPHGKLTRPDGRSFDFWSVSLREHELEYDAWHVPHDLYFSDSGGRWTRTPDPRDVVLDGKRVMVLMHPIYYRGPRRSYFFFSSGGGGAEALAEFLSAATPLRAYHELTLSHEREPDERQLDGREPDERQRNDRHDAQLDRFDTDHSAARAALVEMRLWLDKQVWDYAETSVGLERFKEEFDELFADAVKVHLFGDPIEVVRAAFAEGTYAASNDEGHGRHAVTGWDQLSPFEKCCWHARRTHEALAEWCRHRLRFETETADFDVVMRGLSDLDIPVYPRLAAAFCDRTGNDNLNNEVSLPREWSPEMMSQFERICGPMLAQPRYSTDARPASDNEKQQGKSTASSVRGTPPPESAGAASELIYQTKFRMPPALVYRHNDCHLRKIRDGIEVVANRQKHAHVLFAGTGWHELSRLWPGGWTPRPASSYCLEIDANTSVNGHAELFCLNYDRRGKLTTQRLIGRVYDTDGRRTFSFHVRCDAWRFSVALYISKDSATQWVRLRSLRLEAVPMRPPI